MVVIKHLKEIIMIGIIMRLAVRSCAYDLAYIRNAINTANAGPDPKKYGQMLLMRGKTKNNSKRLT